MDTKEELLAYFTREIEEYAGREIDALKREMETIEQSSEQALCQAAQDAALRWYEQEEEEELSNHAVMMSHLNDENHRRLMEERNALVTQLFERVKEQILAFHHSEAYVTQMESKLKKIAPSMLPAKLYVGKEDKGLLKQWILILGNGSEGAVDETIQLGGFRLISEEKGRMMDETFDRSLMEARTEFLQTSGLTIS